MARVLGLAARNLARRRSGSVLVGALLALGSAVLVFGLAVADMAYGNAERYLRKHFTGDLVVSAVREPAVLGFAGTTGNEKNEAMRGFEAARRIALTHPAVAAAEPRLAGVAAAELGRGESAYAFVVALPPRDGRGAFPPFDLIPGSGDLPAAGDGILVSEGWARRTAEASSKTVGPGSEIVLMSAADAGFSARRARVAGVYRHPAGMDELDAVVYATPSAFRSLFATGSGGERRAAEAAPIEVEEDALFAADPLEPVQESAPPLPVPDAPEAAAAPEEEAPWHFLVLRLRPGADAAAAKAEIGAALEAAGLPLVASGWDEASCGYAAVAGALRIALLASLSIVAAVALLVMANAFAMSARGRAAEIGTLRAVGARKGAVRRLFLWEVLLLSAGSGAAGAAAGCAAVAAAAAARAPISNGALRELLCSAVFEPRPSLGAAAGAVLAAAAVGLAAFSAAAARSLDIEPSRAMRGE